ncbi:hypothetical protein BC939DRAFT_410995 [Gamsiella multidivaricata]|uniref:uncharacterized protein n=1 Tax=Gamsiella multidivaricata TaxID=101098 RepID=UPI00221E7766|nr:uncharacterized protein BC939DRAFT_410995 [Gamsiella multidivaricata]KAG0370972.1 chitin deacetylase [Gamsiella multidivaricata]KAI7823591.1 hypothetical protein BC939DRAFT_410995 [Gamsiella multidivaricata]
MRPIPLVSLAMVMTVASILFPSADAAMSKKQQKQYPPKDRLPDVNSPMVKKWVSEIDWSKVPKIPIAKAEIPNCPECPKKKDIHKDACWWTCGGCVAKDDIEVCPREKAWGLTYDDGPSVDTPRLLKKLKDANVTSTFFVVGSRILEYPETLLQEIKEGHHIGIHTWSHAGMTSLTNEQIVAEIKWAEKIVYDVTGLKTKYWRPPYGDVDNRVREIVRQMGYTTVIWTKEWDSNDWQIPDKTITNKQIFRNFNWALSTLPKLKGGVITLEHDLYSQTVNLAGPLLDMGMKKGLEPMDIARCVNDPHPYQNSLIQKKPVAQSPKPDIQSPKPDTQSPKPTEQPKPAEEIPEPMETKPEEQEQEQIEPKAAGSAFGSDILPSAGTTKKSSANSLAWAASSLAFVAATVLFTL